MRTRSALVTVVLAVGMLSLAGGSAQADPGAGGNVDDRSNSAGTLTPAGLCALTMQFVQGSERYADLVAKQKKAVDALGKAACAIVARITPKLSPLATKLQVAAYQAAVRGLAKAGWLTAEQAHTLHVLAASFAGHGHTVQIDSISPTTAHPGDQVTVRGANFGGAAVRIDVSDIPADVVQATEDAATFVVPAAVTLGHDTVRVTEPGGTSSTIGLEVVAPVSPLTVTGRADPAAGGVVAASAGAGVCAGGECTVAPGTVVTLVASSNGGYRFAGWSGGCSAPTTTVEVQPTTNDVTCTALFVQRFVIGAVAGTGGTVNATVAHSGFPCAGGSCEVDAGTDVDLTAVPNSGYTFTGWSGGPNCAPSSSNPLRLWDVNTICTAGFEPAE